MTAAKTPPERITVFSPDSYPSDLSWDECVDGDKPREYILARVVEKRELALRDETARLKRAVRFAVEQHGVPADVIVAILGAPFDIGCAALAAADEGEAKR